MPESPSAISGGTPGALVRFGRVAAVAGATVGMVLVILDGVAAKQLAEESAAAPPGEATTALRLVSANETVNFALASLFNLLFAGVTFILFGLAVALGDVYSRWSGWVVAGAGVGSIGAGMDRLPLVSRWPWASGWPRGGGVEPPSRRLTGVLLVVFPTVILGGVSLLGLLIDDPAYRANQLRQDLWRAGHAHAGVLLVLALVALRYVDDADLSHLAAGFA
ncbi:MAG TPA: hypothetical protein VK975_05805, partial [Acidimicrobiales bacterium]|nr:hypothetical protein [Acidimicrobiales bacterium]